MSIWTTCRAGLFLLPALTPMMLEPVLAQDQPLPGFIGLPPPPPPLPPPKIEVPKIPRMDERPVAPKAALSPRSGTSFGDRVVRCLEEAAQQNIPPAERDAYSRACAN